MSLTRDNALFQRVSPYWIVPQRRYKFLSKSLRHFKQSFTFIHDIQDSDMLASLPYSSGEHQADLQELGGDNDASRLYES